MSDKTDEQTIKEKEESAKKASNVVTQQGENQLKQTAAVIYIGENLPNLQRFSVFNNGLPPYVQEHIKRCPEVGGLLVPIADFAEAKAKVLVKGTREHTLNNGVKKYLKGV